MRASRVVKRQTTLPEVREASRAATMALGEWMLPMR